jgi:hypothetical protein
MRLHVLYRISGSENAKDRPPFYSKRVALESFIRALGNIDCAGDVRFLCDGSVPAELNSVMQRTGEVTHLPGVGNSGSYRRAIAMFREAREWDNDDLVYFGEDDYLYTPDALEEILAAARSIGAASFFTAYNHPGYSRLAVHRRYRRLHAKERWPIGAITWRSVRTTTMTFAARVRSMREVAIVHELGSRGSHPYDYGIWSATQTISPRFVVAGAFRYTDSMGSRAMARTIPRWFHRSDLLVAPEVALATHLESPWLAADVNWEAVARQSER